MSISHQHPHEAEAHSEHAPSRAHPHAVDRQRHHASVAVHGLMGPEMQEATGLAESKNQIWETSNSPSRQHARHSPASHIHLESRAPTEFPAGSGIHTTEQPVITDKTLAGNVLSVGTTVGGISVAASSMEIATLLGLNGATGMAATMAAAPFAGGALGYFAGKRLAGRPIMGAAAGATISSIGAVTAINSAAGGGIFGALSGMGALAAGAVPAAATGALLYGAGALVYYGGKWILRSKRKE